MFDYKPRIYIEKEFLDPIAVKHGIDDHQSFFEKINSYAEIFDMNKRGFGKKTSNKEISRTLEKVKTQAVKLANLLDDLNEKEAQWLWMAQRHVEPPYELIDEIEEHEHRVVDVMGSPIHIWGLENGFQFHVMGPDDMRKTLTAIKRFAQYGIEKMPEGRDGPKRQHGLYMLFANLEIYWEKNLGRKFTFDEYDGEGITPAYEFCKDVAMSLDSTVTPTQVKSQMRKVIKERR